jgi:uncharacterized cupin superfamily protein
MSSILVRPDERRPRKAIVEGSQVAVMVDKTTPNADLYAGVNVLDPGATIPLHWHHVGEFQFILNGTGSLTHPSGDVAIAGGTSIFSPAGPEGAHGFVNTGLTSLTILFVYASSGGHAPEFIPLAR